MPNVYVTGDKHRDFYYVQKFCEEFCTTKDDVLIVTGDNGVNFTGVNDSRALNKKLGCLPITFVMIKGNHDARPQSPPYNTIYKKKTLILPTITGQFYVDQQNPSVLYATEGFYSLRTSDGIKTAYMIGGAYSVDKYYRLANNKIWFEDEQLSEEERDRVSRDLCGHSISYVFSHTCPAKYIPYESFISGVDQSTVDTTTEEWLDDVEQNLKYDKWYCGHYHIEKNIDNICFLYNGFVML